MMYLEGRNDDYLILQNESIRADTAFHRNQGHGKNENAETHVADGQR